MSSEMKLVPCPFCGGASELVKGMPGSTYVRCVECAAVSDDCSEERAVEKWNRRAASPQPPAPAGEVVAILSAYYGPKGPEVSVGAIRIESFPVIDDRVTNYNLYTTPPTPDADAIRRAALEEAAKVADSATPANGEARVGMARAIARRIRALATQPSPDGRW